MSDAIRFEKVTKSFDGECVIDDVSFDGLPARDYRKLTPSIWFVPRENMKVGFLARLDLLDDPLTHPKRLHEFTVILRAMF